MATLADLEFEYLGDLGATGTLNDRRRQIYGGSHHAYFSGLSGLTPPFLYSLNDHKFAYYSAGSGLTPARQFSLADHQRAFWSSPPATWTPANLPSLALWLDANDASTFTFSSGNIVSEWRDKSVNARHYSQGTVASQPARSGTIGSKPAVVFDGTGDHMTNAVGVTIPQPFTIAMTLVKEVNASIGMMDFAGSGRVVFGSQNSAWLMYTGGGSVVEVGAATLNVATSLVAIYNGLTSFFRADGAAVGSVALGTEGLTGTGWLGSEAGPSKYLTGRIGEVVVCPGVLAGADLTSLEDYLSTKWGTP